MGDETPLQKAKRKLALWEAAEDALASGQRYKIGTRELTRVNLTECRDMVNYFQNEVNRLSAGRRRGMRIKRIIPRNY